MTTSDEVDFHKWLSIIKHNIIRIDNKPFKDSVVFIDVSKDLVTIDDPQLLYDGNDTLLGARKAITDRKKLCVFFNELSKHTDQYKYILCDIFFEEMSPDDGCLRPVIEKTSNLVASNIVDERGHVKPIFDIESGCVNYDVSLGLFVKMPIYFRDTLKSLPVKMYEEVTKKSFERKGEMVTLNGKYCFNSVVPELYYRPYDLRRKAIDGKKANLFYLGDVITAPDFFAQYLKGKIIVLGNFEIDKHKTYLGDIDGSLLLFDTFLTIFNHPPVVSFWWIVCLFIIYFSISYVMFFYPERNFKNLQEKIRIHFLKKLIVRYVSFVGIMFIVDLVSVLFYSTFISVFYVATYLTLLATIIEHFNGYVKSFKMLLIKVKLVKATALLIIMFISFGGYAQIYSVSGVRGNVFWNSLRLKKGDTLSMPKKLYSDNQFAQIRLLNRTVGSILFTFVNGRRVEETAEKTHGELYELTVEEYVKDIKRNEFLTTKGEFDWLAFLLDSCKGRMCLFPDQRMPLTSPTFNNYENVSFIMTIYLDKDSIKVPIQNKNNVLVFPPIINSLKNPFNWKMSVEYPDSNMQKIVSVVTDMPIRSWYISDANLEQIVDEFSEDWKRYYRNSDELIRAIEAFIQVNYGAYYCPNLNTWIEQKIFTK